MLGDEKRRTLLGSLVARRDDIRSMGPGGGGIFVYTALAEAYATLRRAEESVRHVVLFADTADSEEQTQGCVYPPCSSHGASSIDLAARARASGITTSVVGIGSPGDSDVRFQRNLAAAGGGRFYITSQATDLRRIFISEARAATRSSLREETVALEPLDPHQIVEGVDLSTMPSIEGFVQTGRRTTADTALVTPDGRPVLASWRYGLGTVVAWTTDGGQRWTSSWAGWSGAGQIMRQMVRFAMRRRGGHGVEARIELDGGAYEVTVEAPEGSAAGPCPARVTVTTIAADGSRAETTLPLDRQAPGSWSARGEAGAPRFAVARVLDERGQVVAEAVGAQDGEAELAGVGPDERALRELARAGGGLYAPEPAATLRSVGARDVEPVPTWPFALCLAALLVCADLWLRRIGQGKRLGCTSHPEHCSVGRGLVPRRAAMAAGDEPPPYGTTKCRPLPARNLEKHRVSDEFAIRMRRAPKRLQATGYRSDVAVQKEQATGYRLQATGRTWLCRRNRLQATGYRSDVALLSHGATCAP